MTQLKFHDTSDINLLTKDNSTTTWFQPKVKVVFAIIDGFRFDYLLNYENIDHDPALQQNKLNKFNQAYFNNPDKFVVLRAFADLPTMTVLRVPCLMTGNVPRLGSVLTAFGALPAEEDSVPRQLYLQNKKSYFSGDPILHEYFPKYLESDYKIGSFNIGDRTVDQPVQAYINKKLEENKFDFLSTHLLRLDHMGHNAGLYNFDVKDAIEDIDQFLVHIMESIDDNTMLIFGGDHGMTKEGNHGGGTRQETNTAIVAYYKKGFMKNKHLHNPRIAQAMRSINETDSQVHQIDIAPTLSMLMGLPTPFSNMGQILNDLYPVGDYLTPQQHCPDAAFEMQILHDNHLNSLQVWNYFKKYHEGQDLFKPQEFSRVSDLFNEVEDAYKAADEMINQNRQCETSFHQVFLNAILKSQQLSNQVHNLVLTKNPHDLVIFWQAFMILALTGLSYVLLVQYLYNTKDYEYISCCWNRPKSWKALIKALTPLFTLLIVIWAYMLSKNYIMMRPITTSVFVIALWILGSLALSLVSKPPQDEVSENSPTTATTEERSQSPRISLKSFFIFKNPLIAAGAASIIVVLFYLTHVYGLDKERFEPVKRYTPFICILLIAARISGRYLKIAPYIMVVAAFLCAILRLVDIWTNFWASGINMVLGLAFIGDWLYGEIQFSMQKLKAGKIWSYQYVVCFIILVFYHHILHAHSDLTKIYLPRVIWALIIGSISTSLALRMPRKVIKRNVQVYLVLFLTLMQIHRKLVFFAFVLSIMRTITFIFKRTDFKNYLYPLIMGFISYLSLFFLFFTDRKLPRSFGPAFVGVRDFHLGLCLSLYGSAMLSSMILGMLFISFYSQDLESQEVELGIQKEEESTGQVVALKGYSSIIRKRNILFYNLFYCLLMSGAAINPVILKHHKKIYLSMERFLVDGVFYLFVTNVLYLMF